jgi:uncharacterized 2Fe-2S/4Fe-4S cluster protein (DUF4445 family)
MKISVTSSENLAEYLKGKGVALDMRCNGSGRCGRCRVKLVSGEWQCGGSPAFPPAEVPACRTRLVGGRGIVEVPEPAEAAAPAGMPGFELPVLPSRTVAAVDVGTTTLAAVGIGRDGVEAAAGCFNGQSRYGDNVVARIAYAARPGGVAELQKTVLGSLRRLWDELALSGVDRIAVAGNTVMCALLHGVDPTPIGTYPFRAPVLRFPPRRDLPPFPELLTVPCISGYLGGDVTSGLYAADLRAGEMLVDLGTNCEIVFNTGKGYVGTSAAAGPAFEGAGLRSGMRATPGAIERFFRDGGFSVIGGGAPRGICGSAYIDYLALERAAGRINEFGRFVDPVESCREIAPGVVVGEDDVEQLLKAKAAIGAGIAALENHCGMTAKKLVLAGGFACGLEVENAVAIGMLPAGREIVRIGNSSLTGAAALAADPGLMPELVRLSGLPKELPLAQLADFERRFVNALLLP